MTFDIDAWFEEPVYFGAPRWRRIGFLIIANGDTTVKGWGVISWYPSGHQLGLEMEDALDLIALNGFMNGLGAAGLPIGDALKRMLLRYNQYWSDTHGKSISHETPGTT